MYPFVAWSPAWRCGKRHVAAAAAAATRGTHCTWRHPTSGECSRVELLVDIGKTRRFRRRLAKRVVVESKVGCAKSLWRKLRFLSTWVVGVSTSRKRYGNSLRIALNIVNTDCSYIAATSFGFRPILCRCMRSQMPSDQHTVRTCWWENASISLIFSIILNASLCDRSTDKQGGLISMCLYVVLSNLRDVATIIWPISVSQTINASYVREPVNQKMQFFIW
jgi:hypothetical protein